MKNTAVIKLGGNVFSKEGTIASLGSLASQLAILTGLGWKFVLVHGGGILIDQQLALAGIKPAKQQGLRITNEETITVVVETLNDANGALCNQLSQEGLKVCAYPSTTQLLQAKKCPPLPLPDGKTVDLGFVGTVTSVNAKLLELELAANIIPVVAPLACDKIAPTQVFNINADEAASAIAVALNASALVFLSDVPGVLAGAGKKSIQTLAPKDLTSLMADGTVNGGMIPKLQRAFAAASGGVKSVQIIDGNEHGSLVNALVHPGESGTTIAAA